jgi:hypothetical protein
MQRDQPLDPAQERKDCALCTQPLQLLLLESDAQKNHSKGKIKSAFSVQWMSAQW